MADNGAVPETVGKSHLSHKFLIGPLSWITDIRAGELIENSPIKAIWRKEIGDAETIRPGVPA